MPPSCPAFCRTAIVSDDPFLAARLSCVLAKRDHYLAVLDGPRMTRDDSDGEIVRRNNALARVSPNATLLTALSREAREAMMRRLPRGHAHEVTDANVVALSMQPNGAELPVLNWGRERIGAGLLKALYERRLIQFVDDAPPYEPVPTRSGHLVICEAGEPLSEVIAANYAFALSAGLHIIDAADQVERTALLDEYYGIDRPGVNPSEVRDRLQARLRALCAGVDLPANGSITFITRSLPYGVAFPEIPTTHLFTYPDLGIAIINGFAAEQKGTRGTNVAVLVDPGKVAAPEIEAATKLLRERHTFVRVYREQGATVRRVTEMVDLYPYDLLIFATHCGDAPGYRWTYQFTDSEGRDRELVVDIAIGVGDTDDPEVVSVLQFMRFHTLDGVDWTDPVAKAKLHVGPAIRDFMKQRAEELDPVHKENIARVVGSAAMAMADNNYIAMPRSLAAEGSPIVINNACVSWHELASRFTFANARAYIGTLYPVADAEAEAVVTRLLEKFYGKPLAHAVWAAQNAVYGERGNRRPYLVTGVYPQRLRATKEDVPRRILQQMAAGQRHWKAKLAMVPEGEERQKKSIGEYVAFYDREVVAVHERWLAPAKVRPRAGGPLIKGVRNMKVAK